MSRIRGAIALTLAPLAAVAGGVGAAAIEPVALAPVARPCCVDGAYVGGELAQVTGRADELGLPDGSGKLLGAHAGYARSWGHVVLGGEVDTRSGHARKPVPDATAPDLAIELDRLLRARVRLGYAMGRVMPYLSAGIARASRQLLQRYRPDRPVLRAGRRRRPDRPHHARRRDVAAAVRRVEGDRRRSQPLRARHRRPARLLTLLT